MRSLSVAGRGVSPACESPPAWRRGSLSAPACRWCRYRTSPRPRSRRDMHTAGSACWSRSMPAWARSMWGPTRSMQAASRPWSGKKPCWRPAISRLQGATGAAPALPSRPGRALSRRPAWCRPTARSRRAPATCWTSPPMPLHGVGPSRPKRHYRSICVSGWPGDGVARAVEESVRWPGFNKSVTGGCCNDAVIQLGETMAAKQILIVEDEKPIRDMIAFGLRRSGFDVREAEDCRAARIAVADQLPDLVLVDWMLPDMSGLELTRLMKKDSGTREVPVIILTARAEEEDKIRGLEGGADDYITKPFSPRELLARIKAVLRRGGPGEEEEVLAANTLRLNSASHRVTAGEELIALGPTEYRLLKFFMGHRDRVYSRGQLLDRVWGGNVYVEERTVDVHIRRLRKALEASGCDRLIQTVRGAGYRFSEQVDE